MGGKWTVGAGFTAGFTAGLEGAASLLGGIELGEGATATVDIAADRSTVFTACDFSALPGSAGCIINRFNKKLDGTTRGTITHDESFLFTHYDQGNRPFGNLNFSGAGPWNTGKFAISYQVAGDAEKQFTDANLAFSLCPDGCVQGSVTLASGATLSNGATENAAVIYGDGGREGARDH